MPNPPSLDPQPSPAAAGRATDGVRSVQRALALLAMFDEAHSSWSITELARAAGLPKTTTLRLVKTLDERGLLWTRDDGHITIGAGLLRWARLALEVWQLPEPAWQIIRELSTACAETVNVYVRQALARVCIAQQEGPQTVRSVVRVGDELPLWGGASSHILLADVDSDFLVAVARTSPFGVEYSATLAEQVQVAADVGWAQSHGQRESGASGVAAPIVGQHGRLIAALALGGPTPRFTPQRVAEFAPALVTAAARISSLGLVWPAVSVRRVNADRRGYVSEQGTHFLA